MKVQNTIRMLLLAGVLGLLSGCASYPISKTLRQHAQPLTLTQVTANPNRHTGATVIWGGRIVNTVNTTNGASIYVLKLPLNPDGRPERFEPSPGRFIARHNGYLDPQIFQPGRLITVAGAFAGVETKPLQKAPYTYPVLGIDELHLWHRSPPAYYPGYYWGYGPGWACYMPGWGWYGPGWGWGPRWDWD